MSEGRLAPNTEVTWVSQSHGYEKAKTGKIITFVPAWVDAFLYLPPGVSRTRINFQRRSQFDRYLIAVPRRSGTIDYYAPLTSVVEQQNRKEPGAQAEEE